jgi:hypothetical protein
MIEHLNSYTISSRSFQITCIESADITSPLKYFESSMESFVLPLAVDPIITIIGSFRIMFVQTNFYFKHYTQKF